MKERKIVIEIDEQGNCSMDLEGFQGKGCGEVAKDFQGGDVVKNVRNKQEFYVQATRATRSDRLSHEQGAALVESFARFPVQHLTTAVMFAAVATCEGRRISYWDAAILEAAVVGGQRGSARKMAPPPSS